MRLNASRKRTSSSVPNALRWALQGCSLLACLLVASCGVFPSMPDGQRISLTEHLTHAVGAKTVASYSQTTAGIRFEKDGKTVDVTAGGHYDSVRGKAYPASRIGVGWSSGNKRVQVNTTVLTPEVGETEHITYGSFELFW